MQTKLTLRLDDSLIDSIKNEAKTRGVSLSKLVSDYFELLLKKETKETQSLTSQLSGVLKDAHVEEYRQHLQNKHL